MNNLVVINDVSVEFSIIGDNIFADTLKIAEVFKKRHTDILRAIDNLPNDEFKSQNFKYDSYFDKKSEQRRMINLTRDGFSLLVMGFTGARAYKWKIEFIKAFNKMESLIKTAKNSDPAIQSKFAEILSALKEKSNEADEYKAKYYESLENEVKLLRQVANQSKKEVIYNTKLSQAEKENIIKLYKSGLSQAEICRQTNRSDAAVRNAIRSAL
ncbi:MAG: Rha family transcriptional regulator [Campylobacter hyointestinalis]